MNLRPIALLVLLTAPLHADLLVGRVVDASGVGVPGVDIDVDNLGKGGDPDIFNDGTDANGFFVTTVPAGLYDVIFNPPPPPVTSHLVTTLHDVVIFGTKDVGDVVLTSGVTLSGRVVDRNGLPVAGVGLDVVDEVLGAQILVRNDFTNGFGQFQIAVPANDIELLFDATAVLGRTLVSVRRPLGMAGPTNLGDQVLENGQVVTGTVVTTSLVPVVSADIDVLRLDTRTKVFTPGDDTNTLGVFSVVVPEVPVELQICPGPTRLLVAKAFHNLSISSATDLGTIQLPLGVRMLGKVTDPAGLPVSGVDLDVDVVGGGSVFMCKDNTDALGNYSVVVPPGTLDVTFSPPYELPLGQVFLPGRVVASTTTLDASVPSCRFAAHYGRGSAGSGGFVPRLDAIGGAPRASNPGWKLQVSDARPNALGLIVLSFEELPLRLLGGSTTSTSSLSGTSSGGYVRLDAPPLFRFPITVGGPDGPNGMGTADFQVPAPMQLLVGKTLYGQVAVDDPAGRGGLATSAGMRVTICP